MRVTSLQARPQSLESSWARRGHRRNCSSSSSSPETWPLTSSGLIASYLLCCWWMRLSSAISVMRSDGCQCLCLTELTNHKSVKMTGEITTSVCSQQHNLTMSECFLCYLALGVSLRQPSPGLVLPAGV